ncbi:hypothetical protein V8F20_004017 [Naviculisporaceae sp. PSN 640]
MSPVSLSAVERANPPPRKKSCGACIKAKRRCTLEIPACQRCFQRQLECIYPAGSQPRRRSPRSPAQPGVHAEALSLFEQGLFDQVAPSLMPEMGSTGHELLLSPSLALPDISMGGYEAYDPDISIGGATPDPPIIEFRSCLLANTDYTIPSHAFSTNDMPDDMPVMPEINDTSINFYLTAPVRYPKDSRARHEFVDYAMKSRLKWSLDTIVASPKQMVLENRTAWCHPNLYDHYMPHSMQDAQAACALYMAKNDINSYVIFRSLDNRVRELGQSPMPTDMRELLARAQALLLYHIIRIFDGDIRAREQAEEVTHYLEESIDALAAHVGFSDEEPSGDPDTPVGTLPSPAQDEPQPQQEQESHACTTNYSFSYPYIPSAPVQAPEPATSLEPRPQQVPVRPACPRRAFWDTWIFEESARRTWILTYFLIQMYRLLKGNVPVNCDGKLTHHPFTVSAHLWQAPDALSFATAWKTKEHFMVKNGNFTAVFEHANGDDVGTFGKLLITTMIGVDETRHWLQSRGGDL